ncbi:DUF1328 domain-containing protein [Haloarchaeobius sp. HME9146]|uniref:DUF1328 domain-containing protein n=1 Tax=Haloarchaeobius sp. HME9146 TaxID=2978732 RepID=UPI0021BECCF6|nr:DUF1328 domain-containing protein [Haloarchaeobius sp. HME9146]MCT9095968.1 DUF1328 domain-containing protein [Haloarchaeobius sp. HME9146]
MTLASLAATTAGDLLPLLFSGDFLYYGVVFFIVAIVAGVVGMQGVAGISMRIAKILVGVFLILAILSVLL